MAIIRQRLHRLAASGYDTIYLETSAQSVLMANGTDLETKIQDLEMALSGLCKVDVTVMSSNGHGIGGVGIVGIYDNNGDMPYTDITGHAIGYATANVSTTISCNTTAFWDLTQVSSSETWVPALGKSYTKTLTAFNELTYKQVTSTGTAKFSNALTNLAATLVGGGQNGQRGSQSNNWYRLVGGTGGYGGEVIINDNIEFTALVDVPITIGQYGSTGGNTTMLGITARGGGVYKGTAAGTGGIHEYSSTQTRGTNASSGTAGYWTDTATSIYGSSGGGGSAEIIWAGPQRVLMYGGSAGSGAGRGGYCGYLSTSSSSVDYTNKDGVTATGYGCGGGGGSIISTDSSKGAAYDVGNGKQGIVVMRFTH